LKTLGLQSWLSFCPPESNRGLKAWSLQDKSPQEFSWDYRRSFTSEHLIRSVANTASVVAKAVWSALDSKAFDSVLAAGKTAAVAFATKKAADAVSTLFMPKNKKQVQNRALANALVKASAPPGHNRNSRPMANNRAPSMKTIRRATSTFVPKGRRRSSGGRSFGRQTSLPIATSRRFRQTGGAINGKQSTVVTKTEYLQDVAGSVAFTNSSFVINPGLPATFPWLSPIAAQYEMYRFRKLNFRYETDSASTYQGTVMLATDYDVLDAPFTTKQAALDYKGCVKDVTWKRSVLTMDNQEAQVYGKRYVRTGPVTGADLKTYDTGLFQLMTQGQASTVVIGELFVDYEVELIGPKVNAVTGSNLLGADVRSGGTVSAADPLGTTPVLQAGSQVSLTISGYVITFVSQPGQYLVSFYMTGTGITTCNVTANAGSSLVTTYSALLTATAAETTVSINIGAAGDSFNLAVAATTVTGSSLVLQQMSSGLAALPPKKKAKILVPLTKEEELLARLQRAEELLSKLSIDSPSPLARNPMPALTSLCVAPSCIQNTA
jgi:hypothetical protein